MIGANGSIGGSDVRGIAYLEGHTVDVRGLMRHWINNTSIAMVGASMQDQIGEFIAIINHVAYHGKDRTILSSSCNMVSATRREDSPATSQSSKTSVIQDSTV